MIHLTNISPYNAYIKTKNTPESNQNEGSFSAIYGKIVADNVSSDEDTQKYNPQNCSFEELCSTIKALAKEGKLTMHDVLLTTVDYTKSFRHNPNFNFYITPNNNLGRRNWVDEFNALANREFERSNTLGYQRHMERKAVVMKVCELVREAYAK